MSATKDGKLAPLRGSKNFNAKLAELMWSQRVGDFWRKSSTTNFKIIAKIRLAVSFWRGVN
jgi:hypothetical protein